MLSQSAYVHEEKEGSPLERQDEMAIRGRGHESDRKVKASSLVQHRPVIFSN